MPPPLNHRCFKPMFHVKHAPGNTVKQWFATHGALAVMNIRSVALSHGRGR